MIPKAFVLIWAIYYPGPYAAPAFPQEFDNQEACERAAEAVRAMSDRFRTVQAVCVPKR